MEMLKQVKQKNMNNFKSKFLSKSPLNQELPNTLPTSDFTNAEDENKAADNTELLTIYPDRLNSKGETQTEKILEASKLHREAIDTFNEDDENKGQNYRLAMEAGERTGIVKDSINDANLKMNKLISAIKSGDY